MTKSQGYKQIKRFGAIIGYEDLFPIWFDYKVLAFDLETAEFMFSFLYGLEEYSIALIYDE